MPVALKLSTSVNVVLRFSWKGDGQEQNNR